MTSPVIGRMWPSPRGYRSSDFLLRRWGQHESRFHSSAVSGNDPAFLHQPVDLRIESALIVLVVPVELLHLRPVERNLVAHVSAVGAVFVVRGRRHIEVRTSDPAESVPASTAYYRRGCLYAV